MCFRRWLAPIALISAVACGKPSTGAGGQGVAQLGAELSGCTSIDRRGVCAVPKDGTLRVLIASTSDARFESTGGAVRSELIESFDGSRLYKLQVDGKNQRVRVVTSSGDGGAPQGSEFTFEVIPDEMPEWLVEAKAKSDRGDRDGALEAYRQRSRSSNDAEAALGLRQSARVELARDNASGSAPLFVAAIEKERALGRVSDAVDDAMALSFGLSQRGHGIAEARLVLDSIADLLSLYPDGRAREPFYRSQLASEAGDRRQALRHLREAELRASRLGLSRLLGMVRNGMATELDLLGRFDDALKIRRTEALRVGEGGDPCHRLVVRSGIGFDLLMLSTPGNAESSLLHEASIVLAEAASETRCADDYLHATTLGHQALAALLSGKAEEAATRLAEARALAHEPARSESFFWLELDARIDLARKRPSRALRAYVEMERRARAALLVEYEWIALSGRGKAEEMLGKKADALASYAEAEARLDDASLAVPVGEGRARFLVGRDQSAAAAIDLLVASGRVDEAFLWARRARRRALAGVATARRIERLDETERARWAAALEKYTEERAAIDLEAASDWKLPVAELGPAEQRRGARERGLLNAVEELLNVLAFEVGPTTMRGAPLAEGELILLYHPTPHGFLGFVRERAKTRVFQLPPVDVLGPAEVLARTLLGPAERELGGAKRLRLLLPGVLSSLDVHALPYRGAPLLAQLPVEYGLDLDSAQSHVERPGSALVVGDPQRDLPDAKREAEGVRDSLSACGGASVQFLEQAGATHAAVVVGLGTASLFHYAGHATYEGEDGWDSILPLSAGGHLAVSDILTLHHAPGSVVLSGCRAARTSSSSPGDTLGIAQAFLLAGSDVVIAPTRDVADVLSRQFAANLYDALCGDPSLDVAAAARAAQLRLRAGEPGGEWARFRVLRR